MNSAATDTTVIRGRHYREPYVVEIHCKDGIIANIVNLDEDGEALPIIAPGLVDLQVNGYMGIDANFKPLPPEELAKLIEALWAVGVTSFLPTLITNDALALNNLLASLDAAIAAQADTLPYASTVEGIHLEGPFLSPEDGPRGAHNRDWITAPDLALMEEWQSHSNGRLRIVTFSPEWPEAPALVRWCKERGIVASIGHTKAYSSQIDAAVKAGASMSTHLGNGAHPVMPRHPNYIWDQLAADELYACIIADGFHLPDAVIKSFYRGKAGRLIIVSDTVALAGMPAGRYDAAVGGAVVLTEAGRLHLAKDERLLAGSALPLLHGVRHMAELDLCSWQDAWDMASLLPAEAIGLKGPRGLEPGAPADLVLLDRFADSGISINATIKSGQTVYIRK